MLTFDNAPFIKGRVPALGNTSLWENAAPYSLNGGTASPKRQRPKGGLTSLRHLPEGSTTVHKGC